VKSDDGSGTISAIRVRGFAMPTDPSKWEMVDDAMVPILRRKTPAERLAMVFDMADFVRTMIQSHLTATHPDWTPERVRRETARRVSHGAV
jgi:hypothetical protein